VVKFAASHQCVRRRWAGGPRANVDAIVRVFRATEAATPGQPRNSLRLRAAGIFAHRRRASPAAKKEGPTNLIEYSRQAGLRSNDFATGANWQIRRTSRCFRSFACAEKNGRSSAQAHVFEGPSSSAARRDGDGGGHGSSRGNRVILAGGLSRSECPRHSGFARPFSSTEQRGRVSSGIKTRKNSRVRELRAPPRHAWA